MSCELSFKIVAALNVERKCEIIVCCQPLVPQYEVSISDVNLSQVFKDYLFRWSM